MSGFLWWSVSLFGIARHAAAITLQSETESVGFKLHQADFHSTEGQRENFERLEGSEAGASQVEANIMRCQAKCARLEMCVCVCAWLKTHTITGLLFIFIMS